MQALAPYMQNLPLPAAKVAVLHDYDSEWTIAGCRLADTNAAADLAAWLFRRQLVADVIPTERELDAYRLLLIPALLHVSRAAAGRLAEFVKGGGVIVAMGPLGLFDANANYLPLAGPEPLQDLFGLTMESGVRLNTARAHAEIRSGQDPDLPFSGAIAGRRLQGMARKWAGDVTLQDGAALMRFDASFLQGQPAVVERQSGLGRTIYIAANEVDGDSLAAIMDYALDAAGVPAGPETPVAVEVVQRGPLTFIVNHGPDAAVVQRAGGGRALLGDYHAGRVNLAPYDVCVIAE